MDIMLERILLSVGKKHGAKKELCDYLGLKANAVTEWEKGRNRGYTKYLPQIADYYGVSLDWLSGRSEQKENPPAISDEGIDPLDARINELLACSDDNVKRSMIAFLESYQSRQ
ncbi:hypothetical protein DSECCO2_381920 [anaerobic digester metagenome]